MKYYKPPPGRRPEGPIGDRLLARHEVTPEGCWQWTGTITIHGYPQIWYNGRTARAHRLALLVWVGEPPTDQHQADHLCHNKLCINPAHLRWATPSENTRNFHPDGRFHIKGRK